MGDTIYRTAGQEGTDEFTERRSRFIGAICPTATQEQALAFVAKIKKQHSGATHNVHAYRLRDGLTERYCDDGEPQGTAGVPVLDVLQKAGLTDCTIVVTRYFGGVLLGAGGLVRAYSHAASLAVKAGAPVEMRPCVKAEVTAGYAQHALLERLIPACGGIIDDTVYTDNIAVIFHIEEALLAAFEEKLTQASAGRLSVTLLAHSFAAYPL